MGRRRLLAAVLAMGSVLFAGSGAAAATDLSTQLAQPPAAGWALATATTILLVTRRRRPALVFASRPTMSADSAFWWDGRVAPAGHELCCC